jgi:hypothetical protein
VSAKEKALEAAVEREERERIVRYGYLAVQALSGKQTAANIGVNVLANLSISEALAWVLAGGSIIYGQRQAKLRRDTTERMHGRNKVLEERVDPGRTSSQLTTRGQTSPEDDP